MNKVLSPVLKQCGGRPRALSPLARANGSAGGPCPSCGRCKKETAKRFDLGPERQCVRLRREGLVLDATAGSRRCYTGLSTIRAQYRRGILESQSHIPPASASYFSAKKTIEKARKANRAGKAPTTRAGEFARAGAFSHNQDPSRHCPAKFAVMHNSFR